MKNEEGLSLVERLRDPNYEGPFQHLRSSDEIDGLFRLAASRIEQLEAENAGLLEACLNAKGFLDTPVGRRRHIDNPFYDGVVASIRQALSPSASSGGEDSSQSCPAARVLTDDAGPQPQHSDGEA